MLRLGYVFLFLNVHICYGLRWGIRYSAKQVISPHLRTFRRFGADGLLRDSSSYSTSDRDAPTELNNDLKTNALALLDCLTSPKDPDDPLYDVEKDIRRDNLMLTNDYTELKSVLRAKGLRTSGDKLEMITRLLLDVIDPSIKYDELSGVGTNLKYIDQEDIASEKVRVRTAEERAQDSEYNVEPDADDMGVLRSRSPQLPGAEDSQKLVMDGLTRKEVQYAPVRVRRTESEARAEDYAQAPGSTETTKRSLNAYVVVGKDVLRSWSRSAAAVVLLPSGEHPWGDKEVRVLADELAFAMQAVVIVPDIHRGLHSKDGRESRRGGSDVATIRKERARKVPSVLPATVLDDVVAAMQHVRTEFGARTLCLAGVGTGAGVALDLACDLYDLGRAAQYSEIEKVLQKPGEESTEQDVDRELRDALQNPDAPHQVAIRKVLQGGRSVFLKQRNPAPVLAPAEPAEEIETLPDIGDKEGVVGAGEIFEEDEEWVDRQVGEQEARSLDQLLQVDRAAARALEAEARVRENFEEWRLIAHSAAMARERKLMAPFATFYSQEMKDFVPRAVLALQPEGFDVERVAKELVVPAFVVLSDDAASKVTGEGLQKGFSERADDIVDYCIRRYRGTGKRFAVRQGTEYEAKCAQESVSMGALWLEAFCGNFEDGLPDGIGGTKHSSEACRVVEKEEMSNPLRPSAVAAYLHDDPTLFQ